MLNKSNKISRYKTNSGKNLKKCLMHFDSDTRVFVLSNWHKIQVCGRFSSVIFICLTPFFQLQFELIGCMMLTKEYVSLTTAAMKMGKAFTVIISSVANRKNASLCNSMWNHSGHVTFTTWIFLKFSLVIGIIEIWQSRKY